VGLSIVTTYVRYFPFDLYPATLDELMALPGKDRPTGLGQKINDLKRRQ
jgi:hypothetical protein